jgi:hypothetical protein
MQSAANLYGKRWLLIVNPNENSADDKFIGVGRKAKIRSKIDRWVDWVVGISAHCSLLFHVLDKLGSCSVVPNQVRILVVAVEDLQNL